MQNFTCMTAFYVNTRDIRAIKTAKFAAAKQNLCEEFLAEEAFGEGINKTIFNYFYKPLTSWQEIRILFIGIFLLDVLMYISVEQHTKKIIVGVS